MNFSRTRQAADPDRPVLNIASMIDVTFLLLAFFLLTMALTMPEDRLSPNLSSEQATGATEASDFEPQVVEVLLLQEKPCFRLAGTVYRDRGELTDALRRLEKSAGLFVKVHDGPLVALAASALQAGHDAGFEQVTYVPVD